MPNACLFLGYDRPVPGREAEAIKALKEEALPQIETFAKEGWFERFDVIGLTPHCSNLNGFILLQGERAKLDELRRTDAFERFSMSMNRFLLGYGVVPGVTLEGLKKVQERNAGLYK